MVSTSSSQRHHRSPALKILPALLLGCFVAQPLFAQTAAPAATAITPVTQTTPATPATQTITGTATTKPAPVPAPAPTAGAADDMATVEVVATRATNKVDRDVYETKSDISVSNASAADILNNVPAVSVDQDGNVQLRGNSNVQIMVNGKRDAQFQGGNRGDALNAFPAEAIESIEVINVPGAEFGNEGGSGPIINLVLKRNRKPGSRATMSVNQGTQGRYRDFLSGEHAEGPYSISGNFGVAQRVQDRHSERQREDLDPATGAVLRTQNRETDSANRNQNFNAASTFTYNVAERDQAGASLSYAKMKNNGDNRSSTQRFDAAQNPTADYTSFSHTTRPAETFGFGASYDHKSGAPGEDLKFDLRYTGQNGSSDQSVMYDYRLRPSPYTANSIRSSESRNRILDISMDYERNVWDTWHMKAGAKLADNKSNNPTNYLAQDPASGDYLPLPSRISDFESNDKNAAIYGILSTKLFDSLSIQGGLRGEYTQLDVRQPLLHEEDKYHYMNWLPSFYATRDLGDNGMLQLRISRRVQRPNERDLNPNLVYFDDFNARQGNPTLQPVNNDHYELSYRDRFFDVDSSFTLFKRLESPVVSNLNYPLATDPNVIVTSPVNYGDNNQTGIELTFNVRQLFLPGLSANLDTTIENEKRLRLSSLPNATTGYEQSNHRELSKLRLAYQIGMESLQLSVRHNGAGLTGQGTTGAVTMTDFNWRHRITPRLATLLTISNVFHTGNTESFVSNELLNLHNLNVSQPRLFTIGLVYTWGGVTGDDKIRNGGRRGGMFRGGPEGGPRGGDRGGFGGGGFGGGGNGGGGF
jgi:outer membrane receptor protein involved in Fe transport